MNSSSSNFSFFVFNNAFANVPAFTYAVKIFYLPSYLIYVVPDSLYHGEWCGDNVDGECIFGKPALSIGQSDVQDDVILLIVSRADSYRIWTTLEPHRFIYHVFKYNASSK